MNLAILTTVFAFSAAVLIFSHQLHRSTYNGNGKGWRP